jgi:hypothetical protein
MKVKELANLPDRRELSSVVLDSCPPYCRQDNAQFCQK